MKTDSFFYRFFLAFPEAFFLLIGLAKQKAIGYKFSSVEVKDIDFRFDGLFVPKAKDVSIYCVEAQFRKEHDFYPRLFGKIFAFLQQYAPANDWRAIVFFPNEAADPGVHLHSREFFESGRLQRIYLANLPQKYLEKFPLNLLKIIIDSKKKVLATAAKIIRKLPAHVSDKKQQETIVELLINLLVSKLPQMSRKEIEKMFEPLLSDVKKSRFYQEIAKENKQEGREERNREIAKALLRKKMPLKLISDVTGLSAKQIRALTKDLAGRKN
jgi:predicted transposase/invertase (TIGR01784 family)